MVERMWRMFTSMRLGIILLLLFGGISIIGTVVPQESLNPVQAAGLNPMWQAMGFTHLYASPLYRIIVSLLTLNLFICSLNRLPGTIHRYQTLPAVKTPEEIGNLPAHTIQDASPGEMDRVKLGDALRANGYRFQVETQGTDRWAGWAYKGRIGVWGAFLVHAGFLLLVLGTVLGHMGGFKGYFMASEGSTVSPQSIQMEAGHIQSDWEIKINSAEERLDAHGQLDNWFSDVSIYQGGKEIKRQVLSVNHPLIYQGVTFYQTSFADGAKLNYDKSGQSVSFALQAHGENWYKIPDTSLYVIADSFGIKDGRMVLDYQVLSPQSQDPVETGTLRQGESVKIQGRYDIGLLGPVKFTGILLKKDPGVPVIWSASALLLVGLVLAFYFKRQRVWFSLQESGKKTLLSLGVHSDAGVDRANEILTELLVDWERGKSRISLWAKEDLDHDFD